MIDEQQGNCYLGYPLDWNNKEYNETYCLYKACANVSGVHYCYFGVTSRKLKKRINAHRSSFNNGEGAFAKIRLNPDICNWEIIIGYMNIKTANYHEKNFIKISRESKFIVTINISHGGFSTSSSPKWSNDRLKSEAQKYYTRGEFQKKNVNAYNAAHSKGILDIICCHMDKVNESWTEERVLRCSKKCNTRNELKRHSKGAYEAVHRLGISDKAFSHMDTVVKKYKKQDIYQCAKNHKTRSSFRKANHSLYNKARKLGILDKVCSHMGKVNELWPENRIYGEAKKYKTSGEFRKGSNKAYQAAIRNNILQDVLNTLHA